MKFLLTAANTVPSIKYSFTSKLRIRLNETPDQYVKRVLGKDWAFVQLQSAKMMFVVPTFFGKKKDGTYAKDSKLQITRQLKQLEKQGWVKETIVRTITLDYSKGIGNLLVPHYFEENVIKSFSDATKKGFIRGELGQPVRREFESVESYLARIQKVQESNAVITIHSATFNDLKNAITLQYSVLHNAPNKKFLEKQIDKGKLRPGIRAFTGHTPGSNYAFISSITTFDLIENPDFQKGK